MQPALYSMVSFSVSLLVTFQVSWTPAGATENAGVKNAAADSKGGKCRSRQSVWKAEPILSYFLKLSRDF